MGIVLTFNAQAICTLDCKSLLGPSNLNFLSSRVYYDMNCTTCTGVEYESCDTEVEYVLDL